MFWFFTRFLLKNPAWILLWLSSVIKVNFKKYKISDYIANYKPYEIRTNENIFNFDENSSNIRTPIQISNHIGDLDMIIYMCLDNTPSLVANKNIQKYPFIGPICTWIQSIYFDRANQNEKEGV